MKLSYVRVAYVKSYGLPSTRGNRIVCEYMSHSKLDHTFLGPEGGFPMISL